MRRGSAEEATPPLELPDEDEREAELERWLERLAVVPDLCVVVSWDPRLAVETTWSLFVSRASAFWYPSSDDVDVFRVAGGWLLRITHYGHVTWAPSIGAPTGA